MDSIGEMESIFSTVVAEKQIVCQLYHLTVKESKMQSFHNHISEYRNQLKKGAIQKAYRGLMEYIMGLRIHFSNTYPDGFVSSSIYFGTMDMTYFSCTPKSLQQQKLKIAIVFIHEAFRFEVWLAGSNRQVQRKYWKLFNESKWNKYRIVSPAKGVDAIIECILSDNPDFSDLAALTNQIESGTRQFITDVENFLSQRTNGH